MTTPRYVARCDVCGVANAPASPASAKVTPPMPGLRRLATLDEHSGSDGPCKGVGEWVVARPDDTGEVLR